MEKKNQLSKEQQELEKYLWSKRWRLTSWKFYKIKDKAWKIIPFIPNKFQLYYLKNKHNRNTILKARQLGFSTMIQLDFLDDVLFTRNISVGIIAQDTPTAQLIRKDKIEVALNNLPDRCRWYREYDRENQKEIMFNNGSSIYVSNSFRWGTLQRLHISEYGKICAKYPEKAKEIMTWAIESVEMNQQVTIESTAEWNEWSFYDMCETWSKMMWKPHTPLDYKFFFFPRWLEQWYAYDDVAVIIPKEMEEYYQKLFDEFGIELTQWQKNRYYLKRKQLKDDMKREYPSHYLEAFEIATEWSYFQSEINMAYQQNRVLRVPYDPNLMVYTVRDIGGAGWGDDTSIRFFQIFGNEIRWIDYREWSWYSMIYVLNNIVSQKPYKYAKHIGPHDMRVHDQMTGKTRLEVANELWYKFVLVESPAGAVSNRIEMARGLFSNMWFDVKNCSAWLAKLKNYKRKRNESTGQFMDEVAKNGAQHSADSFCYWCQYISQEMLTKLVDNNKEESVISMYKNIKR